MGNQRRMSLVRKAAIQVMRRVPGSRAHGLASYWRDMDRLCDADVALVSFPKSGRTFVRIMLARLYQRQFGIDDREVLRFATLRRAPIAVPRLLFTHDGDAMRRPSQIHLNRKAYRNSKVAILARHPGDIVVSRYYHLKHRSRDPVRQRLAMQPLADFVWTQRGGVPSIVRFLNQWAELARERDGMLIIRYEDFVNDPAPALSRFARFIGLDCDESDILDAVEFARFDNLKSKEREGYFKSERLGPGRAGNEDSYKVRSGKSGGYRAQLSKEDQDRVDSYVRENLDPIFEYGR
jgi:hypothetical protein